MATLTICNHKGGTGKTTSSVHLAAAFGLMGHRVLCVDLDPQGFLTRTVGADEPAREASSLALIDPEGDLRSIPVQKLPHFDLLGASMMMTREQRRLTRPTDVFWLRETLNQGHDYDLILIDTAAAVSVFTMNALVASDAVLIPVTPEYQPVVGAEQTWQTCRLVRSKLNPEVQEPRFLLTQVDGRLSRHSRYTDYLRGQYNGHVLQTPIRTSSSLSVASRDGRTVFDAKTMTRGALDYAHAAAEIARVFFPTLAGPAPIEGAPDVEEDFDDTHHQVAALTAEPLAPEPMAFEPAVPQQAVPEPAVSESLVPAVQETLAPSDSPEASPLARPAFASVPFQPAPPSEERAVTFRHAPVPGRMHSEPVPASAPSAERVAEALKATEKAVEDAAQAAALSIRSHLPVGPPAPPRPSGGDGAEPNIRRFRF